MRKESTESRSESSRSGSSWRTGCEARSEADPGVAGGGGDGVSGRAKSALRSDSDSDTVSERIRQSPEAYAEGNDT